MPAGNGLLRVDDQSDLLDSINRLVDRAGANLGGGGVLLLPDGTIGAPGLAFSDEETTGLRRLGTNEAALVVDGIDALVWSDADLTAGVPLLVPAGGVGAPGLAIDGDPDTGLYGVGADRLGVAVGGGQVLEIVNSGATFGLGVGGAPSTALTVTRPVVDYVATVENTLGSNGANGAILKTSSTNAATTILALQSGGTTRFAVAANGAITGKGGEALAKAPDSVASSANLTLTNVYAPFVPAVSTSLTIGNWLVVGSFVFQCQGAADVGSIGLGRLVTSGGTATIAATNNIAQVTFRTDGDLYTGTQSWVVAVTATTTASLQAAKNAGLGTSIAAGTLTAAYLGNP